MSSVSAAPWYTRIDRWGQVNINEIDDPTVDIPFWIDLFRRTRVTGINVSAGGSIAHYPTNIPLHRRAPLLGDRDTFGEWVAAAKEAGIRVLARLDPAFAHIEIWEAHPDWILQDKDGRPIKRGQARPLADRQQFMAEPREELFSTCWNGPYYWEHYPKVMRELMDRYPIDGFYTNAWPPTGGPFDASLICHCPNCRRKFLERYGMPLPGAVDLADPAWRHYMEFLWDSIEAVQLMWQRLTKELNPQATFMWNSYGRLDSGQRWKSLEPIGDMYLNDNQGRRGFTPIWQSGQSAKLIRAAVGFKPVINSVGIWQVAEPSYRQLAKPAAENTLWMAEDVAAGCTFKWHTIGGTPVDRRWFDYVIAYCQWHHSHIEYFHNVASLAEIGLLWPQRSGLFEQTQAAREKRPAAGFDALQGWYHALLGERLPFDLVSEERLDMASLAQYRLLILPSATCLSNEQARQLAEFAERGGSLIATYETGARNEWGEPRPDFALAGVFGVHRQDEPVGPMPHCYMRVGIPPRGSTLSAVAGGIYDLLAGLEGTDAIPGGQHLSRVEAEPDTATDFTLIPTYPVGPPEKVYPKPSHTDVPLVFRRQEGNSRRVYLAMDIDASYWQTHLPDHARLLSNAVRWALGGEPAIWVHGPGLVDVNAFAQGDGSIPGGRAPQPPEGWRSLTVHLVNLTNPGTWAGPITEIVPLGCQRVSLRLPAGRRVKGVRLLRAGSAPSYRLVSGAWVDSRETARIEVEISFLLDHEVVAIDLA